MKTNPQIMCESCGEIGEITVEDTELSYLYCEQCYHVTAFTKEQMKYFEFCDSLKVPFSRDWVEYKGETFLASVDYEKSYRCHRVVIDLAYCLTYDRTIKTVNYVPEHFRPSPIGEEWKQQKLKPINQQK